MAAAGWYPDPAGTPGAYRFWDGQTWSVQTTSDPGDRPPGSPDPGRPSGRRRGLPLLLGALALAVVLVVSGVVLWPRWSDRAASDPAPGTSASGGDDSSPTARPTPPPTRPSLLSPRPTTPPRSTTPPRPTTPPSPSAPPNDVACPAGDPTARQDHPADGRVHGGGLSFAEQPGFAPTAEARGLSWAYDVGAQENRVEPRWFALLAVGALSTVDGFEQPEQAAELVMEYTASSAFYRGFTGREDVTSESVRVRGRPGWLVRSEIRVENPDTRAAGDVVEVLVVDLGAPESLAMFWGAVPMGDPALVAQLGSVRRGLQVD